jgi:branched-chain amino acid aminotransferase
MWQVIVNGELVPEADATLHVSDLGLRRGYGAFDFFRLVDGVPLFLDDHMERFARSRDMLGLGGRWPETEIREFVARLIAANGLRNEGIQIVLTGGYSADAFTPGEPNLIIAPIAVTMATDEQYATGVKVITHDNARELPDAKTTDYLIAVKLIPQMTAAGAIEVLYHDGVRMSEGARSGFGIVTDGGVLVTAGQAVLESITLKRVLRAADDLMPVELRDITIDEFAAAPEAFLTGTTRGVLPITRVDDRVVGDGTVGVHTQRLITAFRHEVAEYLRRASAEWPVSELR